MILGFGGSANIYFCTRPVDMRKSFDGLSGEVVQHMGYDPLGGDYFVFTNRQRDRLKILVFDRHGFWVLAKRLEQGRFNVQVSEEAMRQGRVALPWADLMCILEGIDLRSVRKFKRYALPGAQAVSEVQKSAIP
jgi:transposase